MSEEDNWGDYLEDSEDEDDSQSDDEVELENVFYEAEGRPSADPRLQERGLQEGDRAVPAGHPHGGDPRGEEMDPQEHH